MTEREELCFQHCQLYYIYVEVTLVVGMEDDEDAVLALLNLVMLPFAFVLF